MTHRTWLRNVAMLLALCVVLVPQGVPGVSAQGQDEQNNAWGWWWVTPIPIVIRTPTPTPVPPQSVTPGNVKMVYQGPLYGFMNDELASPYGHGFGMDVVDGIDRQVFKLNYVRDTTWRDPYGSGVSYAGPWTMGALTQRTRDYPEHDYIIGEEVNYWGAYCTNKRFNGAICVFPDGREYPSPQVYARWLRDVTNAIKAGWQEAGCGDACGKIIGFYFGGSDVPVGKCGMPWTPTTTSAYLDSFWTEWNGRGWGAVPFQYISYGHRPACTNYPETRGGSIARSVAYWNARRNEMLARTWLNGTRMWVETDKGLRYTTNPPSQADRCDAAKRLVNLRNWASARSWVDGVQWFSTVWGSWLSASNKHTALYGGEAPATQGNLTAVGKAFRDGVLPGECW